MEKSPRSPQSRGFCHWLVRRWLALARHKVRVLTAGEMTAEGPALLAVSHPAGLLPALVLSTAMGGGVHCLLPKRLARGALARFLTRHLGVILYQGEQPTSEATLRQAIDVLASGGALVVFADQNPAGHGGPGTLAGTAAALVGRAEAQHVGRRVAVYPMHLFLPESTPPREILVYVDTMITRARDRSGTPAGGVGAAALSAALESRFQENAFQLRPADLEYFFADLEDVLRTGLQEDWAARPDWKQDTEGFVLGRMVKEWVKQTNYLHPARLVGLRKSLDDYRRLQRRYALRELEIQGAGPLLHSGWGRIIVSLETLLGLPVALYGLVNHLVILAVLFLAGSFKRENPRARTTEWTLRGAVTLGFYALQIFLVAHRWGRAAAGYYAPTLPVSGAYLWRYTGLHRRQVRLLLISLTLPPLTRKIKRLRQALLKELDETLTSYEQKASAVR